jgi:hypothetical protein
MKVYKVRAGYYEITHHGHLYTAYRPAGRRDWSVTRDGDHGEVFATCPTLRKALQAISPDEEDTVSRS